MTRRFGRAYLGACVVLTWAALTAIAWLWVRAATRPIPAHWGDDPAHWRDDDVQTWDTRTVTLASGGEFLTSSPKSWTN